MAPPSQKGDVRPISFVLHDMARGTAPVEVPLVIRPEDLTRTDTSRLSVVQTLGGAWADSFGPGIPMIQIAGHTGWGAGDRPDGLAEFQKLYSTVFDQWHKLRAKAVEAGHDPDKVRLIFADALDDFTWVVAPQNFILKRNRSRPLLAQYQINLSFISDDVAETKQALAALKAAKSNALSVSVKQTALESLAASIKKITSAINAKISNFLGPLKNGVASLMKLTSTALKAVNSILTSVTSVARTVANAVIGIATGLARVAANVSQMVHSIIALPMAIKAQFMRVASAFENVFCILSNIFSPRKILPNYSDLYGASLCSSTSGGSAISPYDTTNPFPDLVPLSKPPVSVSSDASASLSKLAQADPALAPMSSTELSAHLDAVNKGVVLA